MTSRGKQQAKPRGKVSSGFCWPDPTTTQCSAAQFRTFTGSFINDLCRCRHARPKVWVGSCSYNDLSFTHLALCYSFTLNLSSQEELKLLNWTTCCCCITKF